MIHIRLYTILILQALSTWRANSLVTLVQSDFDSGSYIISSSGTYVLGEDVTFRPNEGLGLNVNQPEAYLFPTTSQRAPGGEYNGCAFNLGFFSAIVVAADNVIIDLSGKTLEQSVEHAVLQRFFSLIELSNGPFPPGAGPFVLNTEEENHQPKNVTIMNGKLSRSSHHSIHGNGCEDVIIKDMMFTDFEVAAISLNSAKNVRIENVTIADSRTDVPVSGRFSQLVFATRFASTFLVPDETLEAYAALETSVNNARTVIFDVVTNVTEEKAIDDKIFGTLTKGLPDGSLIAGILLHPKVHVGAFIQPTEYSESASYFELEDVKIERLSIAPIETAAFVHNASSGSGYQGGHVKDNVGAVFDIDSVRDVDDSEHYRGNALSDLQIALAEYGLECLQEAGIAPLCLSKDGSEQALEANTISRDIIQWSQGIQDFQHLTSVYEIVSDHDFMFHFVKGAVGVQIAGAARVSMSNVIIDTLENHATPKERSLFFRDKENYIGYGSRAVVFASTVNVSGAFTAKNVFSAYGADTVAIDIRNNSTNVDLFIQESMMPAENGILSGDLALLERVFDNSGCPFQQQQNEGQSDNIVLYSLIGTQAASIVFLAIALYAYWAQKQQMRKITPKDSENDQQAVNPAYSL